MTPFWLDPDDLVALHAEQLARFGGPPGLRDAGMLESACLRAQNKFAYGETDLIALAASYAFGLAKNHAFVDGNKRIAFQAMMTFLALNEKPLRCDPEAVAGVIVALAAGELTEDGLADWLRAQI
jgi:death-on-curing protein